MVINKNITLILFPVLILVAVLNTISEPDPNFHIYLLFGQSNMAGGAAGQYDGEGTQNVEACDCDTNPRVKVLAWGDCNRTSYPCPHMTINRTHDQWYTAFPPFHNCHEGIGPADAFAKVLLDSIKQDITIGFVPCALSGQAIRVFEKDSYANIDDHTRPKRGHTSLGNNAYGWMVDRCRIAQESGVIKGILFHQGESDIGDQSWPGKVKGIIDNLKSDLGLWDSIPFIAGELRYDTQGAHNPIVNKLPDLIPNCAVVSADGLEVRARRIDGTQDIYHFSTKGTKEFGCRYAEKFLELADEEYVPRITVNTNKMISIKKHDASFMDHGATIYSLDGRVITTVKNLSDKSSLNKLVTGNVYLVKSGKHNAVQVIPFVKKK